MSGGSLDYACYKVENAAGSIRSMSQDPLHIAFAAHLDKVAKALHDIEWLFSCDYGKGDEVAAIKEVVSKAEVIELCTAQAELALKNLKEVLDDLPKP
jgi:hypothetical protein